MYEPRSGPMKRNKSAQSNLGKGPRRGAVAHVRRKDPIQYNGAPQIRQYTPSRGRIPKPRYLPHAWTLPTYDAKLHPDPIRRFSTMHWTDRPTDRRTYVRTDRSSTGKSDDYSLAAALRERRGLKTVLQWCKFKFWTPAENSMRGCEPFSWRDILWVVCNLTDPHAGCRAQTRPKDLCCIPKLKSKSSK